MGKSSDENGSGRLHLPSIKPTVRGLGKKPDAKKAGEDLPQVTPIEAGDEPDCEGVAADIHQRTLLGLGAQEPEGKVPLDTGKEEQPALPELKDKQPGQPKSPWVADQKGAMPQRRAKKPLVGSPQSQSEELWFLQEQNPLMPAKVSPWVKHEPSQVIALWRKMVADKTAQLVIVASVAAGAGIGAVIYSTARGKESMPLAGSATTSQQPMQVPLLVPSVSLSAKSIPTSPVPAPSVEESVPDPAASKANTATAIKLVRPSPRVQAVPNPVALKVNTATASASVRPVPPQTVPSSQSPEKIEDVVDPWREPTKQPR